jgi:hypothetical protein
MTNLIRSTTVLCLLSMFPIFASPSWAQTPPSIGEQIAKAYGLDGFGQIEAIRYTFNAQFPGVDVARSWIWRPKTSEISYEGKAKDGTPVKASYVQSQLNDAPANVRDEIDPAFVNDKYNLLFPLQFYWDGVEAKDTGTQKLPLGQGSAKRVMVDYSPGDIWELYVGPGSCITEFAFHRGGPRKPSVVIATWEGYKKAGPLLISTDRRGTADEKPLRVFFTGVSVKLAGSDAWMDAQ